MLVLPPIGAQLVARNRVYGPGTAGGFFCAETVLGGQDLQSHHDDRSSSLDQANAAEAVNGGAEFYSRRSHGPYYRWWYEERTAAHWRSARMHSDFSSRELCACAWKTVPSDLQRSIVEHYQD